MLAKHTLRTSVHDNLRHHSRQEKHEKADRKPEAGPIVSKLQNVQNVSLDINLSIEVKFVERLHRDLTPSIVLITELLCLECEVGFDGLPGKLGFFILPGRETGCNSPKSDEDGKAH